MIPVFSSGTFEQLIDEVGSRTAAVDFLITFTSLLPARIERISRSIEAGQNEGVENALLSLQVSATMAGATQLQASVTHALVRHQEGLISADPLVRKLQRQADMFTKTFLDFHYNGCIPQHTRPPETPGDRPAQTTALLMSEMTRSTPSMKP